MNEKIICIGIISIFLLSSLSLNVAGTKLNNSEMENEKDNLLSISNNPIDLVFGILKDENGNEIENPYIDPFGTDILITFVVYNIYAGATGIFKVAFFWNDNTEPFLIKTYSIEEDEVLYVPAGVITEGIPSKKECSNLQITMKLDYNNDIPESNDDPNVDAEENNIGISNTIENPKVKSINPLFSNIFTRLFEKHPYMFPLLRAILGL